MIKVPAINFAMDASGARQAGQLGQVVVIVDVIDMSTSLETALEAGAIQVYGASPKDTRVSVPVNPVAIGQAAGKAASQLGVPVVIVAEPRWGPDQARILSCGPLISGLQKYDVRNFTIVPNLGASTGYLVRFKDAMVIAVTGSGGVAFDAAWTGGGTVLSATVARTPGSKGEAPARRGVLRALTLARKLDKDITFVAASGQSMEDVLAANFLVELALSITLGDRV